jgi:hypothetical protein
MQKSAAADLWFGLNLPSAITAIQRSFRAELKARHPLIATYKDSAKRARQLANALDGLKLAFATGSPHWLNGYRHSELYLRVSARAGAQHHQPAPAP